MLNIKHEGNISAEGYDGIVLVSSSVEVLSGELEFLRTPLLAHLSIDKTTSEEVTCIPVNHPAQRLIFSPTGPLNRDFDDERRFSDAANAGIKRALKAGVTTPLLVVVPNKQFIHSELVGLLGALHALYVPIEIREDVPSKSEKVKHLGFLGNEKTIELAKALEVGRIAARDIGGSDPERMAPPRVEEYVRNLFNGSSTISVKVISNQDQLVKDYPLFSAVNRCAKDVERHRGRVIITSYEGKGPIQKTLFLVGKGVTYDTGGADIKAGGIMAGMHRDKCGAAAVAGFMKTVEALNPPHLKVVGALAMVRNSVGSDCYVADEIITARSGARVRVGNTDAEGRMAMADVLCQMKEDAINTVDPHLFTVATLTGHAVLAYGESYSAAMDNGPARDAGVAVELQRAGVKVADNFEVSTIRREDYEFHKGKSEYEDILQCNNLASSRTPRGHQTPSAFLILASGLDKHGKDSAKPLKYTHLDIAGGAGPFPGIPTGTPVLALAKAFIPNVFS